MDPVAILQALIRCPSVTPAEGGALDYLEQKKGHKRFALIGLCSGVDSAHAVTVADPRVVGAAFIDGYTYRTLGYHLRFHLRYLSPRRWSRFLRKRKLPSQLREAGEAD